MINDINSMQRVHASIVKKKFTKRRRYDAIFVSLIFQHEHGAIICASRFDDE